MLGKDVLVESGRRRKKVEPIPSVQEENHLTFSTVHSILYYIVHNQKRSRAGEGHGATERCQAAAD